MAITLEPVQLDSPFGDSEGMLARRDGRLFAVLSCLGDIHGTRLGHWYIEAVFAADGVRSGQVFPNLQSFEEFVEGQ